MTTTLSLRPKTLNFDLYAGDGFAVRFLFTDKVTGDPYPLTGDWTAQIRKADEAIADFLVETDAEAGEVNIALTGEQTEALQNEPSLFWDLQSSDGPRTWYRGAVHVVSDVSA